MRSPVCAIVGYMIMMNDIRNNEMIYNWYYYGKRTKAGSVCIFSRNRIANESPRLFEPYKRLFI